ncbi:MAG: hypothetical protein H6729_04565 [Deltaproteobacteria bacterium]|nr:hypothetical protein [Deltaproteobacteria bacterium]
MLAPVLPLLVYAMLTGQFTRNSVSVPADALPPGWATVTTASSTRPKGFVYSVRAEIERGKPTTVELFTSMNTERTLSPKGSVITVIATSDEGPVWRQEILEDQYQSFSGTGFIGTPTDLSQFTDALYRATSERWVVDRLVEELKILAPEPLDPARCRVLAAMDLVIVVGTVVASIDPYVECAARGARIFAIAKDARGVVDGGMRISGPTTWGLGAIAFVDEVSPETVYPLVQIRLNNTTKGSLEALLSDGQTPARQLVAELQWSELWPGGLRAVRHGLVFTLLVGLFVVLIGPLGYFAGIRPRKPWLAWGWFPAVSVLTSGAIYLVGRTNAPTAAHLDVGRVFVSAPNGNGTKYTFADLVGIEAGEYTLSTSWRDAAWENFELPTRLGTPFARSSHMLTDVQTTAGRDTLEVKNLPVGRFTKARLVWSEPSVEPAPHVETTNPIVVVNPRDESIFRGVLVSHEGLSVFGALAGHATIKLPAPTPRPVDDERRVALERAEADADADAEAGAHMGSTHASLSWLRMLASLEDRRSAMAPGTYLLITEFLDDEISEPTVVPAVERRGVTMRVVAGPMSEVKAND